MALTKQRLKNLIKEEISLIVEELEPSSETPEETWNAIKKAHTEVMEISEELYGMVDPDAVQGGSRTGSNLSTYGDELAVRLQAVGKLLDNLLGTLAE